MAEKLIGGLFLSDNTCPHIKFEKDMETHEALLTTKENNAMNRILVGSSYFFSQYPDFMPKDIDEVELIDHPPFKQMRQITGQGHCLFQLRKHESTEEYIQCALQSNLGMVVGKFLVPEFCELISFTIADLPRLYPLIQKLDEKHMYEAIIFDSYLQNGDFVLTESQRKRAYYSYQISRQNLKDKKEKI